MKSDKIALLIIGCVLSHVSFYEAGNTVRYSCRIRDQLDVTNYYVLFHFFYTQHVSDINTSIIRSLRLSYCITTFGRVFLFRCVLEFRCGWVGVVSV